MKEYKTGDSICFRSHDDDRLRWGKVLFRLGRGDTYYGYEIEEDGEGLLHTVMNDRVVDLAEISGQASAALDRIHAEDRRQAGLLHHLLGALSFYAKQGGEITYRSPSGRHESVPVADLLAKYQARADDRIPLVTGEH
jgi:hypothetical protein